MSDRRGGRTAATAQRRQAILDAALSLFASRGFTRTSIEDICAASGASNGSFYHHFGCKEGVAAKLYATAMEDYQRDALVVFRQADGAEAGIRGAVEQFLGWVGEHRDLATLMLGVEHSDIRRLAGDRVDALNAKFLPQVAEWIDRHVASGELPPVPGDLLMPALLGPARRFAELWLEGRTVTPIDTAARFLSELAWRGLGDLAADTRGAASTPARSRRARR